jgi:hypothetical protein
LAVLIDGLCVVIARETLDALYHGGCDEYLRYMGRGAFGARYVCADEHLTCAGLSTPSKTRVFVDCLRALGIEAGDEFDPGHSAFVRQRLGLIIPCPWIEWALRGDGVTFCWLKGHQPGEIVAPVEPFIPAGEPRSLVRLRSRGLLTIVRDTSVM